MHWLVRVGRDAAKEMVAISIANVPIAVVCGFLLRAGFFFVDGWLLLIETGALVVVGGAMELLAGSTWNRVETTLTGKDREWSQEGYNLSVRKALTHTLAGLLIFAEALLLGLLTAS